MPNVLADLLSEQYDDDINMLEKTLKLYTTKSTSNMHLFDENQRLKKYDDVYQIIEDYYPIRYKKYIERKEYLIKELNKILKILSNKARFIKEQCDDVIDLRKKKKQVVIQLLKDRGYDLIFDEGEEFNYLRKMPIDSVMEENYLKLMKEMEDKKIELETLEKTTIEDMWYGELDELEKEYLKYQNDRRVRQSGGKKHKKKKSIKMKKK